MSFVHIFINSYSAFVICSLPLDKSFFFTLDFIFKENINHVIAKNVK